MTNSINSEQILSLRTPYELMAKSKKDVLRTETSSRSLRIAARATCISRSSWDACQSSSIGTAGYPAITLSGARLHALILHSDLANVVLWMCLDDSEFRSLLVNIKSMHTHTNKDEGCGRMTNNIFSMTRLIVDDHKCGCVGTNRIPVAAHVHQQSLLRT